MTTNNQAWLRWMLVAFIANGVDEIRVSTATDYVEPLVRFFRKREKTGR